MPKNKHIISGSKGGNIVIEMIFEKRNGQLIRRIRNTYPNYKIGEETSMGWKVIDIRYRYKNKYYHRAEYDSKVDNYIERDRKLRKFKRTVQSLYRQVVCFVELSIVIRFISLFIKGF